MLFVFGMRACIFSGCETARQFTQRIMMMMMMAEYFTSM